MSRTALVTGSSGFIGYYTSARLLADGWRVIGLDALTDYYEVSLKERRQSMLLQMPGFQTVTERIEVPANPRSFAGSYFGEMGDTIEYARLEVNATEKPVMVEGRFVTRTVERSPQETPFEPTKIEMDSTPWFSASGKRTIFVTYMDPNRTIFPRPVNGLIRDGLFYVKESELER